MPNKQKIEDYEGFVEKFKPKKTTDDCMTPPEIYEIVKEYACKRYGIEEKKVVRPFWPGGDYRNFDYSGGKVVIDNPPFSILSKIIADYLDRKIPFFLFAPSLTLMSSKTSMQCNHIACECSIVYENGAVVNTSFVTSYGFPNVLETFPELTSLINDKARELKKGKRLPKYEYPNEVITAAIAQRYSRYGINFSVAADEAVFIRQLESQKKKGKTIFGGGLLLSQRKAAERAAAERAAVERWELSEGELETIRSLH